MNSSHIGPDAGSPGGRLDIHSHLLPGIDDGCRDLEDSLASVHRLKSLGYIGSICTPHVIPYMFPDNTVENIHQWTHQLRQQLEEAGVDYRIWPGGELRLFDGVLDWLRNHRVPTLAQSRCVLVDFWEDRWPNWVIPALEWLLNQNYQPILAHPERVGCLAALEKRLPDLARMGVWLQGNFRCFTGMEGFAPSQAVRRWLDQGHYDFLALDMHRPDDLETRLDGLGLVEAEFGQSTLDRLTIDAPIQRIFSVASR